MATYDIAIDAGNGGTNGARLMKSGVKTDYFPSVRARATGDSLGLSQFEMKYDYVDWRGHRYIVGDDIAHVSRDSIETHQGKMRYGNEFAQFLIAVSCARLGIKKGSVNLVLFAPPGLYNDVKHRIIEELEGQTVEIQMKGDKKPRKWTYEKITVLPEGIGTFACMLIDKDGKTISNDNVRGLILELDIGMYTLDALQFVDGNFNPENLTYSTWEQQGIHNHVLSKMLPRIRRINSNFELITEWDIDRVLRSEKEKLTLESGGMSIDLTGEFEKHAARYAEWIANTVIDGHFQGLRGYNGLILAGGGALLVENYLKGWYEDKRIITFNQRRDGVSPVFANAVGGVRILQAYT